MTDDDGTIQFSMAKAGNSSGRIRRVAKSSLHPKACNLTTFIDAALSRRGPAMEEQGKVGTSAWCYRRRGLVLSKYVLQPYQSSHKRAIAFLFDKNSLRILNDIMRHET